MPAPRHVAPPALLSPLPALDPSAQPMPILTSWPPPRRPLQTGANGNAMRSFRTLRILRSLRVLRVLKVPARAGGRQMLPLAGRRATRLRGAPCPPGREAPLTLPCLPRPPSTHTSQIFRYLESLRVISQVLMGSMGQFLAVSLLMVGRRGTRARAGGRIGQPGGRSGSGGPIACGLGCAPHSSEAHCAALATVPPSPRPRPLTRPQVLFISVFALIGLQVFGAQSAEFEPPLPSFLGFWNAFILVFQVLTLEVRCGGRGCAAGGAGAAGVIVEAGWREACMAPTGASAAAGCQRQASRGHLPSLARRAAAELARHHVQGPGGGG